MRNEAHALAEILWLFKRDLQAWEKDRWKDSEHEQWYQQLVGDMILTRQGKKPNAVAYQIDDIPGKARAGPAEPPPGLVDASCGAHDAHSTLEICNRLWNLYFELKKEGFSGAQSATPAFLKDNEGAEYANVLPKWWTQTGTLEDFVHSLDYADQEREKETKAQTIRPFKEIKCTASPLPFKMFKKKADILEELGKPFPTMLPKEVEVENPCLHLDLAEWRDHLRTSLLVEPWHLTIDSFTAELTFEDPEHDHEGRSVLTTYDIVTYDQLFDYLQMEGTRCATFRVNLKRGEKTEFE